MSEAAAAPAVDVSSIPASALPPGADPAAYVAQTTGAKLVEPTLQTPADVAAAQRPTNVPEKFWDAANNRVNTDALLKSYTELEKMKGKPAEPAAEPAAPAAEPPKQDEDKATIEKPAEGEAPKADEGAKPDATPVGTLVESLTTKYTDGSLGDADFAAAEAAGLPRSVVETYFAGLKALEATQLLSLETAAGGKETLVAARTWAATALNDDDLAFYNTNVTNPTTAAKAVQWLADKFKAANPSEGNLVTNGAPSSSPAGDVFRSAAEVTTAMSDPKYRSDPSFRQAVAEKLARSREAGTYSSSAQFFKGGR